MPELKFFLHRKKTGEYIFAVHKGFELRFYYKGFFTVLSLTVMCPRAAAGGDKAI
jgi:hypothetical protein